VAVKDCVNPFAIEGFGGVTAMETRVGSEWLTECEQLQSRRMAHAERKSALQLRLE
jgi:hypothetical protein